MSSLQSYSNVFRIKIITNQELNQPVVLEEHVKSGFQWIRRREAKHFNRVVRTPVLGYVVELSVMPQPYSIPLTSRKAKKLIGRLDYFTHDVIF